MTRSKLAWKVFGMAAVGLAGAGCAAAPQTVPVIQTVQPAALTPTPAGALGISPQNVPPGPVTIWQKLGLGKQQLEYCRRRMCDSPGGALMARVIAPMSALTGGLIPPFCSPVPTAAELLDPGVIGANSKVKQDKLNAEKRKKAVEELAGVDCHYWPEAEDALILALRADRNECVRHTAALALQRGCCCTKKTVEALTICVYGGDWDGLPCEKSCRVRAAAAVALEMCLEKACCPACPPCPGVPEAAGCPVLTPPPGTDDGMKGGEKGGEKSGEKSSKADDKGSIQVAWAKPGPGGDEVDADTAMRKAAKAYYESMKKKSMEDLLARARHCLNTMPPLPVDLSIPVGHPDYEAAGVRTAMMNPARPDNLLDMLAGRTPDKTAAKMAAPMIMSTTVVTPPVVIQEPVKTAPVKAIESIPVKTIEATPVSKPAVVKPVVKPVETPKPAAMIPVEPVKPAAAIPKPMPAKVEPVTVSPLAMPVTSAKPFEAPKPLPAKTMTNAGKVMAMLDEPSDMNQLRMSVEMLTFNDLKDQPKLTTALLKAAEYPSDTGFRLACMKAVHRSKVRSDEVKVSFVKLAGDKDRTIATEAGKLLADLKN